MRLDMRQATAAEASEDYAKRLAALDRTEAEGIYSVTQVAQYRAELETFGGYPRPIGQEPEIEVWPVHGHVWSITDDCVLCGQKEAMATDRCPAAYEHETTEQEY